MITQSSTRVEDVGRQLVKRLMYLAFVAASSGF